MGLGVWLFGNRDGKFVWFMTYLHSLGFWCLTTLLNKNLKFCEACLQRVIGDYKWVLPPEPLQKNLMGKARKPTDTPVRHMFFDA